MGRMPGAGAVHQHRSSQNSMAWAFLDSQEVLKEEEVVNVEYFGPYYLSRTDI